MQAELQSVEIQETAYTQDCIQDLIKNLRKDNKSINPKFFYNELGSELFEKITQLPEYYPTRTERSLLSACQHEIAAHLNEQLLIIEPGAGSCEKIKLILDALKPSTYIPIDISESFVKKSAADVQAAFPNVRVKPHGGDMRMNYPIELSDQSMQKLVFYPGSTIGNYEPEQALAFLEHVNSQLNSGDALLIGVDLHKDKQTLHAAYNDAQGITALFNLNALNHVNELINSNFDLEKFEHVAFYNEEKQRIEMHLESTLAHSVSIAEKQPLSFNKGERIHTEYSYKYTLDRFKQLAQQAGFDRQQVWLDDNQWFSLQLYFKA